MKKLLVIALFLNAVLLAGRFCQELPVARGAGGLVATDNGDLNGDRERDIGDAIYLLHWLFNSGPEPVAFAQVGGGLTPEQEEMLGHMSLVEVDNGQGALLKTIRFEGVNVQVVNGLGATNGYPEDPQSLSPVLVRTNGLGNLIVGYQELRNNPSFPDVRTGSHNIVTGNRHGYSSFGGFVAGSFNTISGPYSSVSGGATSEASGNASSVSGGAENRASGQFSSISGGTLNVANNFSASVSGGEDNLAGGAYSSVSGGKSVIAAGDRSHPNSHD